MPNSHESVVDIVYCCRPSLYSSIVLDKILSLESVNVVAVVASTRLRYLRGNIVSDIYRLLKESGFSYAIYLMLVTSIYNTVGGLFGLPPVFYQCKKRKITVFKTKNINTKEGSHFVDQYIARGQKAILLTVMFNQKISSNILDKTGLECINLHPGKLPEYRGVDPVFSALAGGEKSCTVCLHQTAVELDTGNILDSQAIKVEKTRSVFWHNVELFSRGASMVCDFLSYASSQELKERDSFPVTRNYSSPTVQEGKPGYFSWPTGKEVSEGRRLFYGSDLKDIFFSD